MEGCKLTFFALCQPELTILACNIYTEKNIYMKMPFIFYLVASQGTCTGTGKLLSFSFLLQTACIIDNLNSCA